MSFGTTHVVVSLQADKQLQFTQTAPGIFTTSPFPIQGRAGFSLGKQPGSWVDRMFIVAFGVENAEARGGTRVRRLVDLGKLSVLSMIIDAGITSCSLSWRA